MRISRSRQSICRPRSPPPANFAATMHVLPARSCVCSRQWPAISPATAGKASVTDSYASSATTGMASVARQHVSAGKPSVREVAAGRPNIRKAGVRVSASAVVACMSLAAFDRPTCGISEAAMAPDWGIVKSRSRHVCYRNSSPRLASSHPQRIRAVFWKHIPQPRKPQPSPQPRVQPSSQQSVVPPTFPQHGMPKPRMPQQN